MLVSAGCGVAAWHQYRTRRTGRSAMIAAATAVIIMGLPYVFEPLELEALTSFTDEPAVPLGAGMRFQKDGRTIVMRPLDDRNGQCGVMARMTQVISSLPGNTLPRLSYRFVHRPTGRPLNFTYFALPDRSREMAAEQGIPDSEAFQRFQILYRHVVVGPLSTSDDPRTAELKSISCRDVDVVVRH
jgi:hypothetical protein